MTIVLSCKLFYADTESMRLRSILVSILLFYSQATYAKVFLTYNEYYALSSKQQSDYIDSVRQLALSLEKNPYLTINVKREPSSALSSLCDVKSAAHYSTDELLSKIEQMMNCSEKPVPGGPNYFMQVVPSSAEVLSNEYKKRLESGQLNRKSLRVQEARGVFSAVLSDIRNGVIVDGGDFSQQQFNISNNIQVASNLFQQGSPTSQKVKTSQKESKTAKSQTSQVQQVRQDSSYLCLYAGFVISKNDQSSCQPMSQLPKNFNSSFFDNNTFICLGQTPVLCNPLLFGFESACEKNEMQPCYHKKPLCISRSSSATKNCHELAKIKNALPHVEEVWKSPEGETLYNDYVNSLESLCDFKKLKLRRLKKSAQTDILQTCKLAFEIFQDQIDAKFLPRGPKDSNSTGQK